MAAIWRTVRVFVSSTFRDMMSERDALMSHTWPRLREFCHDRQVELLEVDMRWGISEEQSTRKETLKLCLDEIRACRPFFIGLLGERYGWIPGDDAFTADLEEEQPWIAELHNKSITELEILHGVLNNPEMANRSFFYFRDPAYSEGRGQDFQAEDVTASKKQADLKERIRKAHKAGKTKLHENYPDPGALAEQVLENLKDVIDGQFPKEYIPDALTQEANRHEAFAESRRRTYIGREDYFKRLDRHIDSDGGPLVLLGESGSGKSALLANWIEHWRKKDERDIIFQHYIGSTPDSTDHWQLMKRFMAKIKKWVDHPSNYRPTHCITFKLPTSHVDIERDFPSWLTKARLIAKRNFLRCILIIDALDQLEDHDNSRLLGWLPADAFTGRLRLIISTLPGDTLDSVKKFGWDTLKIEKFTENERRQMIIDYLERFGKKLDPARIERIIDAPATANPLYLKILLDELRITGTHEKLDERLDTYLAEPDIPSLLRNVLARYQLHYESDRKNLVKETLGLIFSARRGLSEKELLQLLRPPDLEQLPAAIWTPLRAAMEELLIDRGGILNFAHDFLRTAVKETFVPERQNQHDFRLQLADYFERLPISARRCDELPWLLCQAKSLDRLRACLLDIDSFLEILRRDGAELRSYWIGLGEQTVMGKAYLESFERWSEKYDPMDTKAAFAANKIGLFLKRAALYEEAEQLMRKGLSIDEKNFGKKHRYVGDDLSNLAGLLYVTNRMAEAELLMRRALSIYEKSLDKIDTTLARGLNNLARLLQATNRMDEAKSLYYRSLNILAKSYGREHPMVAQGLNNLAELLYATNQIAEAETFMRKALSIYEKNFGKDNPAVATVLSKLAILLHDTNRMTEAEKLYRRTLSIYEKSYGKEHPYVATSLNNLAQLLKDKNRMIEAEPLIRRALSINEKNFGKEHPDVAKAMKELAYVLQTTNRHEEAESLLQKTYKIWQNISPENHEELLSVLNNLGFSLVYLDRFNEAEHALESAISHCKHGQSNPYYWLAKLYQRRDQEGDERKEYNAWLKYLELGPTSKERKDEASERIKTLHTLL